MTQSIPQTMKAIVVGDDGDRTLSYQEQPTPELGAGEVLVEAHATAVNRADLLQRAGRYPVPKGASSIMGLEVAGTVVALGEGVSHIGLGDRVAALVSGGGYGQYVACHERVLLPVPEQMPMTEAAAHPEALYTAYLNLYMEAALVDGERALVHAGASGVGTAAIQICRALGNPVYATASGGKLERLREIGVDLAIDRVEGDFVASVREASDGHGVDAILCPVGANYLQRNIDALARGGRLVIIGLLGGASAELPIAKLLMKRQRVIGSVLRSRSVEEKAEITRQLRERVWPHVLGGAIKPVIDRVLPIEQAGEAQAVMKRNENVGKLVLSFRS